MTGFLLRRLGASVLVIVGGTILVFGVLRAIPGDPIQLMLGTQGVSNPALVARYTERFGLDLPAPVQYLYWVGQLVRGDLGDSIVQPQSVGDFMRMRAINTAVLGATAWIIAVLGGTGVGIIAALLVYRRMWVADYALSGFSVVMISIPSFSLALILMIIFGVNLGWLPVLGMQSVESSGLLDRLRHLVLPAVTLATVPGFVLGRIVKAAITDALLGDYARTAYAKGLSERRVFLIHVLRNAMVPIVTNTGLMFGGFLSGSVLVEFMFAWPGLGRGLVNAILARDFPIVQGITLLILVIFTVVNLLVDLSYGLIDPRIRYARA